MAADARSLARRVRLRARPCHGTSCVHRTGAAAARTWAVRARHAADREGGRGHGAPSVSAAAPEARLDRLVGPRLGERPLDPSMGGQVRFAEPEGMDVLRSLDSWERKRDDLLSPYLVV